MGRPDPTPALRWLEQAFGCRTESLVTDAESKVVHSEMTFRGGETSVGREWGGPQIGLAPMRSPTSLAGIGAQASGLKFATSLPETTHG